MTCRFYTYCKIRSLLTSGTVLRNWRPLCTQTFPGEDPVKQGGHADRTKLEGDIYDDTPSLNAEQEYERQKEQDADDEIALKSRILGASLPFVPKQGWSKKAILSGLEAEKLSPTMTGLFQKGPVELVHHFYHSANSQSADQLQQQVQAAEQELTMKRSTNEFIKAALWTRLLMLSPYIETWPQAMALMALPQNTLQSVSLLKELVDDIWFYAGDKSTDLNWYTKRALLAGVYQTSVMTMIQDSSEGFSETSAFLDRQMKRVSGVGKEIKQVESACTSFGDLLYGSWTVGKNMLGLRSYNR